MYIEISYFECLLSIDDVGLDEIVRIDAVEDRSQVVQSKNVLEPAENVDELHFEQFFGVACRVRINIILESINSVNNLLYHITLLLK